MATLLGYTAYFGAFEVNEQEGLILHHMEGNLFPDEIGTTRQRSFVFSGDCVTLATPPFKIAGEMRVRRMVWARVKE